MKLFLAVLLLVGAALGNSTHRYAWQNQREYVYRYESKVDFSIPEIRSQHKSGLRLTSIVRIQSRSDYSLLIKLDQARFMTFNGLQTEERREEHEEPIPSVFKSHLEKPFKVHLRRGVVEALFVERDEPIAVTNIKKAILSNLNMDLSASRRAEILSNRLEVPDEQTLEQSTLDQSYFTTREQSLHGDCQTSYNIHPLADYEAMEIEESMERHEKERNQREHLQGGLSSGRQVCEGKRYWQITKTRNFDNCLERPVFQKWSGLKSKCDTTKATCQDLMTHASATNYIVCGNDIRDFVIRKSITENAISTQIGWKTEEKFLNKAEVVMEILREETNFSPMNMPSDVREIKNLIFEYPERTMESHRSLNEELSEQEKIHMEKESGVRPILPKPDLRSAPKMLVPVTVQKDEVVRQVIEHLQRVAQEIFESPESCTSKGDVAGYMNIVAKSLRPLSLQDLKSVESKLESQVSSRQQEHKKLIRNLFYDVVSMIGTNPAVMLFKERVMDTTRIDMNQAIKMVQTSMSNIRTPTPELLRELVNMVKEDLIKLAHDRPQVYATALVQLANLLNKACVDPTKTTAFPTKIYGQFCHKETEAVQEFVQFLKNQVRIQENRQLKLNSVAALGKIATPQAIQALAEIIEKKEHNEMVRSLAVYSLQRAAKLEPVATRAILMKIIDNVSDLPEVRIAAVAILPYSQPSSADLQKIALRTWMEPSKEFASFVYSTFRSLSQTQVPELKLVGLKTRSLLALFKPVFYGMHYAKNWQSSKLVNYLNMVVNQEYTWVKSKESIVPQRFSMKTKVYTSSAELDGSIFTFYTRGMDKWIDMLFKYTSQTSQSSQQVRQELEKIVRQLNIEKREHSKPELYTQYKIFDNEYTTYLDEFKVVEALEQLSEQLSRDMQSLTRQEHFEYTRVNRVLEAEGLGPCDAGFPIYIERAIPMVVALRGYRQLELEEENSIMIPKSIKAKVIPVINLKMEGNMGVISPFTQEFIGASVEIAAHYATPLEMKVSRQLSQLSLDVKVPEELTRELEALHIFITPFTVRKDLKKVQPVSKSGNVKVILSGAPVKEYKTELGRSLEIDAKLIAQSDAQFTDLYSYWEKIRQHNVQSLLNSFFMPSTMRMSSAKIIFNPQQSRTKEVSLTFGLVKVDKEAGQQEVKVFPSLFPAEPVNDMNHIKEVCMQIYPRNPPRFSECVLQLSTLEYVTETVDSLCHKHNFANCQKLEHVCNRAKVLCETTTGYRTAECKQMTDKCLRRVINIQNVHRTLEQLGNQGSVVSIRMDADLRGSGKSLTTGIALGLRRESSTPQKETVQMVSNVEVKTSESPVYQVKVTSKAEVPRVNNRWNKDRLIEEALKMVLNGQIEYGYESRTKQTVKLNSEMAKSEKQKESVRKSPEFERCSEEEQKGRHLANVCEFSRHQAASIDEIMAEIQMPRSLEKYPVLVRFGQLMQAYFIGQLYEEEARTSIASPETLKLVAKVNRVGDEAQLHAEIMGRRYTIKNIRMPQMLKGILPISMRNPLKYNVMQKITQNQIPASCRVEPRYISTFDNKTYEYELNDCYHLLFKDCSQEIPVAVMAKQLNNGQEKEIKILAGEIQAMLKSEGSRMDIRLDVNGRQEVINVQPGNVKVIRENGRDLMEIKRYEDGVYLINALRQSLWVLTDGKRIEVSGSYMLRSRACGLCGDLNGENTADLKTPRKCMMSRPRYAAYSYMMEESCQGIPSQDKSKYQEEKSECIKEEVIPTPLQRLAKIVLNQHANQPMISQHLVQKQNKSGQVCISVQKIDVCSKINKFETVEPQPMDVQRKRVQYVCMDSHTQLAQQLEKRAKAGETLDLLSAGQPIAFSKIEYEPRRCQRQSNRI